MVYLFSVERLTGNNRFSTPIEQVARDNIDWIFEEDRRFIQHQLNTTFKGKHYGIW